VKERKILMGVAGQDDDEWMQDLKETAHLKKVI